MSSGSHSDRVSGSWDNFWGSLDAQMVRLYTRGRPSTIHQFWQQCYAEDLRNCYGENLKNARFLELGAGRGTTSMYLTRSGCDVTMLDLSSSGFELAKANFSREDLKVPKMVQADARDTRLPSESYDCIFSIGLLEHFDDPRPVLVESVRLLRPGGLHFGIIIPDRYDEIRHFAYLFFRPWSAIWARLPQRLRHSIRPPRRSADTFGRDVLRTALTRPDYLKMLDGLGVTEARCLAYNGYHPVYNSQFLETNLLIPMYRAHRAFKRLFRRYPLLATWGSVASCDLLIFRKRRETR
jgi:2-polyprenyl-3-methyl-5-hydroxy-6-metoxy-1,4-benzoquinol methylase